MLVSNLIATSKEIMQITKTSNGHAFVIEGGIFGTFNFTSESRTEYEDCGGHHFIESNHGESTPVYRNDEYFLSWHITAAITNNGQYIERSWIWKKSDSEIIAELLKMKSLAESADWFNSVRYVNKLVRETPAYVY